MAPGLKELRKFLMYYELLENPTVKEVEGLDLDLVPEMALRGCLDF